MYRIRPSDRGVVLFRQVLKDNIERVQRGLDPLGVIRDGFHDPAAKALGKLTDLLREELTHPRGIMQRVYIQRSG